MNITREQIEAKLIESGWQPSHHSTWKHPAFEGEFAVAYAVQTHAALFGPLFPVSVMKPKQLEFTEDDGCTAITEFGEYRVSAYVDGSFSLRNPLRETRTCDSLDHGKALCQADFESRLSACYKN